MRTAATALLLIASATACTSTPGRAAEPAETTRASGSASVPDVGSVDGSDLTRCRAVATGNRADVLDLSDVWASDNGGHATSVLDLRACAGAAGTAANFVCRLDFPWLTAADTATGLAALEAERVTFARLVSPSGAELSETLVEFAPGTTLGIAALRRQAVACGGRSDRRGYELALWSAADGEPTWALRTSGSIAVAVTYTGSGLSRRQQQTVMDRAWAKGSRAGF